MGQPDFKGASLRRGHGRKGDCHEVCGKQRSCPWGSQGQVLEARTGRARGSGDVSRVEHSRGMKQDRRAQEEGSRSSSTETLLAL